MTAIQEAIEYIESQDEVVSYIEKATRDSLPPTRGILKNFGSAVAQQEVSDS
ncbi:hypothetical protein PTT_12494 [Pyrenophora teres f. teres 0-1]|uniref:Uncharacterized protein n=1 Tax=Pyrenophora teres f. teres (strain 0-1) TaxID=861557 RepID=E3RTX6_PYRTT|nr:hypothetical protein PTT_12494 [Pyrenophora teres f. teres 0-1]